MIKFNKITFHNFRQYRDITISFDSKYTNLYVLRAKNGTGKTTFLNGILWCLYGKEYNLTNSLKALPLLNDSIIETSLNPNENVEIELSISDESDYIVIKRIQHFVIKTDPRTGEKRVNPSGKSELTVVVTNLENKKNSETLEKEEAELLVKQYFDESIYSYFFFDGEDLKDFFSDINSQQIKKSIHNISQVNLLSDAADHALTLATEKSREANKDTGDLNSLYEQEDELNKSIADAISENKDIEKSTPKYLEAIKRCEEQLRGYEPVKKTQLRRDELNRELSDNKKLLNNLYDERNEFLREYIVLLNFYPFVKHSYDLIELKEKQGSLPPSVDKKQVIQILNEHIKNCPLCDNVIDDNAKRHLQSLLEKLEIPYGAAIDLKEIKGSLEIMMDNAKEYETKRDRILKSEKFYLDKINDIEEELASIKKTLSSFESEDDKINVSSVEQQKSYYDEKIRLDQRKYGENSKSIENDKKRLEEVKKQIQKIEDDKANKDILNQKARVFRKISSSLNTIKENIMRVVKEDIETDTWHIFEQMLWKKNTFSRVIINDNYELSVLSASGKEMLGGMSATEYMALAYSFTLAIHKAAGKNCPLVVDSPLGRTSDDNREKMAKELLKVSREKQIIMLFTPDEYSTQVRDVYEGNISLRDISLTSDEKEIKKVGE